MKPLLLKRLLFAITSCIHEQIVKWSPDEPECLFAQWLLILVLPHPAFMKKARLTPLNLSILYFTFNLESFFEVALLSCNRCFNNLESVSHSHVALIFRWFLCCVLLGFAHTLVCHLNMTNLAIGMYY